MQILYGGLLFLAGAVITYGYFRYRRQPEPGEEIDFNHVFKDQQEAFAILEKLPSGVALLTNHKVVYCNRAFSDMLHSSQHEFQGGLIIDIFHPEDQRNAFKRMTEVQEGGQEYSSEFRLRTREGHILPAEVFIHQIMFENGRNRLVLIFHDLTAGRGMEQALVEFQERYNTLVEHAPEAIVVYDAIAERFVEVNRKAQELFGLNKEMLLRIGPLNVSPDIQPNGQLSKNAFEDQIQGILEGKTPIYEWVFQNGQGSQIPCEVRLVKLPSASRFLVRGSITDITARKKAEVDLRTSEERYALAALGANDGLWDWDIAEEKIYYSPRWKEMLGFEDGDLDNSLEAWFDRVHPNDINPLKLAIDSHLNGMTSHFQAEFRIQHKDGEHRWMLSRGQALFDHNGKAYRMAGSQTDITEIKETEERLRFDSTHDDLTGLADRGYFINTLERLYEVFRLKGSPFAVMYVDIDRFKQVNDSLGHIVGDQLLIEVARRLEKCAGEEHTVARLAGDEFALLVKGGANETLPLQIANCIHNQFALPFDVKGQNFFVGASIGITIANPIYEKAEHILRDADIAMYYAKESDTDRIAVFDPEKHKEAVEYLRLETDLRGAVDRNEFEVHYQPILSVADKSVVGLEALVRWNHPELGMVFPSSFVDLADDVGVLVFIDNFVLETAAKQLGVWEKQNIHIPRVVVNLSAKRFREKDLYPKIVEVIKENNISPNLLDLKLKKTVMVRKEEEVIRVLNKLKDMGVQITVDDFGTLHSSFSQLKELPIDGFKLHRYLLRGVPDDGSASAIAKGVISMGHEMGLLVVAEGVETEAQYEFLKEHGCDQMQGFLFAKALPPEEVPDLLDDSLRMKAAH